MEILRNISDVISLFLFVLFCVGFGSWFMFYLVRVVVFFDCFRIMNMRVVQKQMWRIVLFVVRIDVEMIFLIGVVEIICFRVIVLNMYIGMMRRRSFSSCYYIRQYCGLIRYSG